MSYDRNFIFLPKNTNDTEFVYEYILFFVYIPTKTKNNKDFEEIRTSWSCGNDPEEPPRSSSNRQHTDMLICRG